MSISFAQRGSGCEGYQVRITRSSKTYTKFFNAKDRGAKKKAEQYEAKLLAMLPAPISAGRGRMRPVRTNTGKRYITEAVNRVGSLCFRVTYRTELGHWDDAEVSIAKHGRTKALKLTRQIRRERHIKHPDHDVKVKPPSKFAVSLALDE